MTANVHRQLRLLCATALLLLVAPAPKAHAQAAGNLSGHWIGTFDTVNADGSVDPANAVFDLTATGATITGKAGDSPAHLSPISSGSVSGDHVTFSVPAQGDKLVVFNLTRSGNSLQGTATGLPLDAGAIIHIEVARADEAWHTSTPVSHEPDHLFEIVAGLDRQLFDAYNACDLKTLANLVSEDLEFYHDKTGLAVGRDVFIKSIQNNICGKVHRTLTPGSLEVHRLAHYGAVEIGLHTFSHPGRDSDQGQAKFTTIWRYKDGNWQMTRAISYDHEALKQ